MAKTHRENGTELHSGEPTSPSVPHYDDGAIETMRVGGYIGVLPYRQYPDLPPSDQRALNVGRRYLAERAAQSALAKAVKEGKANNPAAFLADYLAKWEAPTNGDFDTVAGRRAEIARQYIVEKFPQLANGSAESQATVEKTVPVFLAHATFKDGRPGHAVEIARRLAAFYSTYVAPKERATKDGAKVDDSKIAAIDPDAVE